MGEFFAMTVGRVLAMLSGNLPATLLALFASFVLCVGFQVFVVCRANKAAGSPLRASHFAWTTLFVLYLMVVYRLTGIGTLWSIIDSTAVSTETLHLVPFASFGDGALGFLFFGLNILMTVPLGLFLAALWPRLRSLKLIAVAGFCFSLAIELSQLFTNRGTNVDDLIANTFGAVVGYGIYLAFARWRTGRETRDVARDASAASIASNASPSKTLSYEGLALVALSFLGMFIFFNPTLLPQYAHPNEPLSIVYQLYPEGEFYASGDVATVEDDYFTFKIDPSISADVSSVVSTDAVYNIYRIDIWRID